MSGKCYLEDAVHSGVMYMHVSMYVYIIQVISQLREKLGSKYGDNNGPIDGVPIGFRLPDGRIVSRNFSRTDTTKVN